MHSRVLLVLLMIVALLGMAMHTAADVAHAATAAQGDCGSQSADGAPDGGDGSNGLGDVGQHCCSAACHSWVPVMASAPPLAAHGSRDSAATEMARLASMTGEGLRRPPRLLSEPLR